MSTTSNTSSKPSRPDGTVRRLLVIDDDKPLLGTLRNIFGRRGWEVTTMPDGLRALAELRRRCFDAVVVDEWMSGPAGPLLAETVADMCPGTRVVLYSGWPSALAFERGEQRGWPVIMKGATHDELVAAVEGRSDAGRPQEPT